MIAYKTILVKMYSWYLNFECVTFFSHRAMKELVKDKVYHHLSQTRFYHNLWIGGWKQ